MPHQTRTQIEVVRELFAATDAMDTDAKLALITDTIRLKFGNAPLVEGRDAFRQTSDEFNQSLTSVRHTIETVVESRTEDLVVTELTVHYVRHDGGELDLPCCNTFRFRDGRVDDYRIYMDIGPVYA